MTTQIREWNSQSYHKISNPQFNWGLKVLDRVDLKGNETVMDIGCGTGRLTEELLRRLPSGRVVAVDLSFNMLQSAKEVLAPKYADQVRFALASATALPFNSAFDGIFSTAVFHWVKDHEKMFRSLAESLKPGGWIVAQCGGKGNLDDVHRRTLEIAASPQYSAFFKNWSDPWEFADAETTARRMREAGFVDIETNLEESPIRLQNGEEYRAFLGDVILRKHLNYITDTKLREKFLEELVQQAVTDPAFKLDYWRLNLRGVRGK